MVLVQLLLPTSGVPSDDNLAPLAQTRRELAERFNGLTAYVRSPAKGWWTAPDGHTEQDDVVIVEVAFVDSFSFALRAELKESGVTVTCLMPGATETDFFERADMAEPMALRLRVLKRRAAAAGVPVIYVNDNFGQWRSDFRQTVAHCTARTSPGRLVSQRLRPTARDYFVLKPKHSGFLDTTLHTSLGSLGTRRVILTGIAGNICVLFTANDAHMRDLKVYAPADGIVSNTVADNEHALRQIQSVMKDHVAPSTELRFQGRRPRKDRRPWARTCGA